jgi:hypothetical protein
MDDRMEKYIIAGAILGAILGTIGGFGYAVNQLFTTGWGPFLAFVIVGTLVGALVGAVVAS